MDKLNRMAVFAVVVAEGSFSAAGRRLGMSPSAVSQHMRTLEQDLRVTLLHRSTRNLRLPMQEPLFIQAAKRCCMKLVRQSNDWPKCAIR